jgi:hypothetical protein
VAAFGLELREIGAQLQTVSGRDAATHDVTRRKIHAIESELAAMDVEASGFVAHVAQSVDTALRCNSARPNQHDGRAPLGSIIRGSSTQTVSAASAIR